MDNQRINRIVGVVIIFAIIFFGLFWFSGIKLNKVSNTPTPNKPVNKIENFKFNVFPREFPQAVPIEKNAQVISNYNATSPDGSKLQATRVFISSKSVADNFTLYKAWLTKNKWKMAAEINDKAKPDNKALFATNSRGILTISIIKSSLKPVVTVDISFLVNNN